MFYIHGNIKFKDIKNQFDSIYKHYNELYKTFALRVQQQVYKQILTRDYDPRRRVRAAWEIDRSSGCLRRVDLSGLLVDGGTST